MNNTCDVILIKGEDGKPLRINASDYDEAKHSLYKGKDAPDLTAAPVVAGAAPQMTPNPDFPPQPAPSAADFPSNPAPQPPSPNQRLVKKEGKGNAARFFIVNAVGEKLTIDGVNPDGYASEQEAWNAVMALQH